MRSDLCVSGKLFIFNPSRQCFVIWHYSGNISSDLHLRAGWNKLLMGRGGVKIHRRLFLKMSRKLVDTCASCHHAGRPVLQKDLRKMANALCVWLTDVHPVLTQYFAPSLHRYWRFLNFSGHAKSSLLKSKCWFWSIESWWPLLLRGFQKFVEKQVVWFLCLKKFIWVVTAERVFQMLERYPSWCTLETSGYNLR